jgi:hypothetical protein
MRAHPGAFERRSHACTRRPVYPLSSHPPTSRLHHRPARDPIHRPLDPPRHQQEDDKLLKGLLTKEKDQAGPAQSDPAVDEAALRSILGKYDVAESDIQAVMKWRGR